MIIGAHMPNAHITPEDLCRFRVGGFEGAKLLWYHTERSVLALMGLGCRQFVVRLPNSTAPDGRWKGDEEWAFECVSAIKAFSRLGIRDYIVDNEPNEVWDDEDAEVWRWLTGQVVGMIREHPEVPTDIRLGLTPLSWKPDTWKPVQEIWVPEQRLIMHLFDWVAVHSYWQRAEHFNLPPFGGNATHFHFMFGGQLPVMVTEWGNSSHELGLPPEEVERIRREQYPQWLRWISTKPYVEGTYMYILGGTPDWHGFHPTDKVLRAIGSVIDNQVS